MSRRAQKLLFIFYLINLHFNGTIVFSKTMCAYYFERVGGCTSRECVEDCDDMGFLMVETGQSAPPMSHNCLDDSTCYCSVQSPPSWSNGNVIANYEECDPDLTNEGETPYTYATCLNLCTSTPAGAPAANEIFDEQTDDNIADVRFHVVKNGNCCCNGKPRFADEPSEAPDELLLPLVDETKLLISTPTSAFKRYRDTKLDEDMTTETYNKKPRLVAMCAFMFERRGGCTDSQCVEECNGLHYLAVEVGQAAPPMSHRCLDNTCYCSTQSPPSWTNGNVIASYENCSPDLPPEDEGSSYTYGACLDLCISFGPLEDQNQDVVSFHVVKNGNCCCNGTPLYAENPSEAPDELLPTQALNQQVVEYNNESEFEVDSDISVDHIENLGD